MIHPSTTHTAADFSNPIAADDYLAYLYDGSLEGLLCAIFDSYERHEIPCDVYTAQNAQPRLGQVFHEVKTDITRALRVRQRLIDICGSDIYSAIRAASLSEEPNTGSVCVRFARYALDKNKARWKNPQARRFNASHALASPEAAPLLDLERYVMNERHYMMQFLRFEELEGGVWFARCHPKASVVPLLMDYFSARFNTQAFIIYDERHKLAGVYEGNWTSRQPFLPAGTALPGSPELHTPSKSASNKPSSIAELQPEATQPQAQAHSIDQLRPFAKKGQFENPSSKLHHWYLVKSDHIQLPNRTENEEAMRDAWKRFYRSVSINERYHPELRRQFMPMRFWDDLTEFQLD